MLNAFQRVCADNYDGGDFSHVGRVDEAKNVGDTLFAFLMVELASSEGCNSAGEAVRRLDRATADIAGVIAAIERA